MAHRQLAHIDGELLAWARTTLRLSREAAAKGLRITPERLESWETNKEQPTIPQLRRASEYYKRPLAVFYLPEPPRTFTVPHDFRRLPDRPEPEYSRYLILEMRKAVARREAAIELAEDALAESRNILQSVSLSDDVERTADEIRSLLGVTLAAQERWPDDFAALNGWKNAIEALGVLVFHFSRVDVGEVRGFSIAESPFPIIGLNGRDTPYGRVFTLLHEFNHLLLGRGGSCNLRERKGVHSRNQRVEIFCNKLAAATLVPSANLAVDPLVAMAAPRSTWHDWQLQELSDRYRVSKEVILRRLLALGKTTRQFYGAKRSEFKKALRDRSESSGFLTPARASLRAAGQPFTRLVFEAYNRDEITANDVCDYLGVKLKRLPEIEKLLQGPNRLTGSDL